MSEGGIPWERWVGESPEAFHAYTHYRGLSPTDRSLDAAYRAHQERCRGVQQGRRRVATRWVIWAKTYAWAKRVGHWDEHLDQQAREAARLAVRSDAERWARERSAHRESALELGKKLLARAGQMLDWPLARIERQVDTESGRVTQIVEPAEWRMGDVPKMAATADKLIRLAAEMETDRKVVDLAALHRELEPLARRLGKGVDELVAEAERIIAETRDT